MSIVLHVALLGEAASCTEACSAHTNNNLLTLTHNSYAQVALLGEAVDLTYKYEHLGSDPAALGRLLSGGSPFLEKLKAAKNPAVVVGPGVLRRADRDAVMKVRSVVVGW